MNTLLNYLTEKGDVKKLSLDMTNFNIEEHNGYCIIVDKINPEIEYQVIHSIQYLHMLSNGFDAQTLN